METGNNCKCILDVMREAQVKIEAPSRPLVEIDLDLSSVTTQCSVDARTAEYRNPLLETERTERQLNKELAATKPIDPLFRYEAQSGPEGQMIGMPGNEEVEQNILFKDQMPGYSVDIESPDDPTRQLQDTSDVELADFFERPVKIYDERWGTGTVLNASFNPWEKFFENKRVVNRIANFNLLRCKLHLKVVINGNGFQYGRAIVAYHPLFAFDQASTHAALVPEDLVQTSQLPKIFIDPTTSTGGEMTLPFFWHKNNANLSKTDLRSMGTIFVRMLNALRHANDAPDVANVTIFAWASGVELNVLTSRNPVGMTAQSGKEKKKTMTKTKSKSKGKYTKQAESGKEVDEANHSGMVSGPATAISKAAGALAFIPQIAPFAMATSKVAGTVATVAKALGYSRPPVTKNPDPLRPFPTSQLATTNTPDTAIKLTVDEKQELTIDPSIAGIGSEDPMSIKSIAGRESYLTTFNWNIGTGRETLLWNSRVMPTLWRESGSSPKAYHLPACAMAAMPFKYWTGTMKFRFQIVSSIFHKGRLKFVYDPQTIDPLDHEFNTNYIEIIDIAESKDFTLEIGNGQEYTLLDHATPAAAVQNDLFRTSALTSGGGAGGRGNGVLAVYVLNELTTPSALAEGANDIQINVFVSMGDDFEVFIPSNTIGRFITKPNGAAGTPDGDMETQSGIEQELVPDSENTDTPNAPEQPDSCRLGIGLQDTTLINKVYTGESIVSFRPLLKRYNLWRREVIGNLPDQAYYSIRTRKSNFPAYRGSVPGAVDMAAPGSYNYCNTVMLHWVTLAHQGWRGSVRYKALIDSSLAGNTENMHSRVYIERSGPNAAGTNVWEFGRFVVPEYNNMEQAARTAITRSNILTGLKGMAYANSAVNPNVEFEVPYYSRYRFAPGKILNQTGTDQTFCETWRMDARVWGTRKSTIDYHVAAGEDFQVYFWTGMPRLYWQPEPPFVS